MHKTLIVLVQCPAPNAPVNGGVTLEGSIATYSCDAGYELLGEPTRTCSQTEGMWSNAAPNCEIS